MITETKERRDTCLANARYLTSASCSDMRRARPAEDARKAWVEYYKANQQYLWACSQEAGA